MRFAIVITALSLLVGGCVSTSPPASRAEPLPSTFDHLTVGVPDLPAAMAAFAQATGVTPRFTGKHPARGTQNALVSLGGRRYLELLGPDPVGMDTPLRRQLQALTRPTALYWVATVPALEPARDALIAAGIPMASIGSGLRQAQDGREVRWRYSEAEPAIAGAPFLIEWAAGTAHPSGEAAPGCSLGWLRIGAPDIVALRRYLAALGDAAALHQAATATLQAEVRCGARSLQFDGA